MSIVCLGLLTLPSVIGPYCLVQGKIKNDTVSLFFAGIALISIADVIILIAFLFVLQASANLKHKGLSCCDDGHEHMHTTFLFFQVSYLPSVAMQEGLLMFSLLTLYIQVQ